MTTHHRMPPIKTVADYDQALQAIEVNARVADLLRAELERITDPAKRAEVQRWITFHSDRAALIRRLVQALTDDGTTPVH